MTITLEIDETLVAEASRISSDTNRTLSEVVWLFDCRSLRQRTTLRTFAGNSLKLGLDQSNNSALQD